MKIRWGLEMEAFNREIIKDKLRQSFDGKIVRKDLTKKIKEGANVPVYVLEFLLGQYCSSDDEMSIEQGIQNVKKILADNFVRPDEAQKILSNLRSKGNYTVIDKVTVSLNIRKDQHEAEFSNLGLSGIPLDDSYPEKYDRLLCGGIWCIIQLEYTSEAKREEEAMLGIVDIDGNQVKPNKKKREVASPIKVVKLTPIQMPNVDINQLKEGRRQFSKEEWMDVILRSIGMEPDKLKIREKWLLLARMIPLMDMNK